MPILGRELVGEIVRRWGLDDRVATQVAEFVLLEAADDLKGVREGLMFCDEAGAVAMGTAMARLQNAAERVKWTRRKPPAER